MPGHGQSLQTTARRRVLVVQPDARIQAVQLADHLALEDPKALQLDACRHTC